MSQWSDLTARTLAGLGTCEPIYQPTNFWSRGLRWLLKDLDERKLEEFKYWPSSSSWFYPIYGNGFSNATIEKTYEFAKTVNDGVWHSYINSALNGSFEARRDFDVAYMFWNRDRWPIELENLGESRVGKPRQYYPVSGVKDVGFGRPYLNYLMILSALSNHVEAPPKSVLEIGGGFGVLGEILMTRDPEVRYVDVDIPPLITVASYYLTTLFGDRVMIYDDALKDGGPIDVPHSAVLPNWRIEDVTGDFDVALNAYSFQEMEPDVVEHYATVLAGKNIRYVVSLNSVEGKPKAKQVGEWGVIDPVTSDMIEAMFQARGYRVAGSYGKFLTRGAGRLVVFEREQA